MADDSSQPMAKALAEGARLFPCGPFAPKPYPRPTFFRHGENGEMLHDIEPPHFYTMHHFENGWRYTYRGVECKFSTAGPCIDTADCMMITADYVGE